MSLMDSQTEHVSEEEAALLDAELFMKYQAADRAIKRLRTALELNTRSIKLRERLREICASQKQVEEAARQCLALASLYIDRKSTRLNSSHLVISYAVFCLKKKNK